MVLLKKPQSKQSGNQNHLQTETIATWGNTCLRQGKSEVNHDKSLTLKHIEVKQIY